MRLWSIHPRFLDGKGLVALWREGLLARAVLSGQTRGYHFHPQLERFRARRNPIAALDCYLSRVLDEAGRRGYRFDGSKIRYARCRHVPAQVSSGQLDHERRHLEGKLARRDPGMCERMPRRQRPLPHPCFVVIPGPVAGWERAPSPQSSQGRSTIRPRARRRSGDNCRG
jgi:hypothetical protein